MTRSTTGFRRTAGSGRPESRLALGLLTPSLLVLAAVIGYPVVAAVVQSFRTDSALRDGFFTQGGDFAGFSNYTHWLLERCGSVSCPPGTLGSQFWDAVYVTALFTVVTVAADVVLGTAMALVMHQPFRGRAALRAAVLVPWAIPTAVTAKLWMFVFAYDGIVNRLLGTHVLWLSGTWSSRFAVISGDVWKTAPFVALLVLAGLQFIPEELYQAARVDGTTAVQRFFHITLPLVRPALIAAALFRTLDVLRIYDLPAILTNGGGGSGHATTTPAAMFPTVALVTPLFQLFSDIHWIGRYRAMIVPDISFALPLAVWLLTGFLTDLPVELEQAAQTDGRTRAQAFRLIVLPLAAPGVFATTVLVFIATWNEYLLASLLSNGRPDVEPVTVAIADFTGAQPHQEPYTAVMAAGVVVTVPLIVLVLLCQRRIVSGLTAGALD